MKRRVFCYFWVLLICLAMLWGQTMVINDKNGDSEASIQKADAKLVIAREEARNGIYERSDTFTEQIVLIFGPARN